MLLSFSGRLEFSEPALVYEYPKNGSISQKRGIDSDGKSLSLSWKVRFKVAKDIANAITYLHTAFPRPIIHMKIQPSSIFLDKDIPKLGNFCYFLSIPKGKMYARIEEVHREYLHEVSCACGKVEFLDPDYYKTSIIMEHYDVYGFGIVLLALLTGQEAFDANRPEEREDIRSYVEDLVQKKRFNEIVDPKILEEEGEIYEEKELQLKAFLKLALGCNKEDKEERPLMIDIAKQLFKIEKSTRRTLGESVHSN
ncbi:Tyrosine-protein kinase [Parasponia andersonii]|uniref:Tyrosine-protein kinase n=1 Tax=Parasponia andersonii TaxID=3476 RepID=A0A2P5D2N3_PARAD|nr:Tyrosine-protein kinase [Parasponia andersonii]